MPFQKQQQAKTWTRITEESGVENLLAQGCILMSQPVPLADKAEAVIVLWTTGMDRLLRLLRAMEDFDSTGARPTFAWAPGERLTSIEDELFELIEVWLEDGPGWDSYPGKIYGAVSESVSWRELGQVFDIYDAVRREDMDSAIDSIVTDEQGHWRTPRDQIKKFHECLFHVPHVKDRYSPTMSNSEFLELSNEVDRRISDMVLDWWFVMTKLAALGAFGETARRHAARLAPGRLSNGSVAPLSKVRMLRLHISA